LAGGIKKLFDKSTTNKFTLAIKNKRLSFALSTDFMKEILLH